MQPTCMYVLNPSLRFSRSLGRRAGIGDAESWRVTRMAQPNESACRSSPHWLSHRGWTVPFATRYQGLETGFQKVARRRKLSPLSSPAHHGPSKEARRFNRRSKVPTKALYIARRSGPGWQDRRVCPRCDTANTTVGTCQNFK